jgi:hypothetical protein
LDIVNIIAEAQNNERKKSDELNATYAERLFDYRTALPKELYETRFQTLKYKYCQLMEYGIYANELKEIPYEEENQRALALSIFLEEWEKKIVIYDGLIKQINLFCALLNDKQLAGKSITVKAKNGFNFTSAENKSISVDMLSSGEQNETILLYELIFKAKPNSLVLIDEPETSLHVSWQHDFLRDLRKIQKVNPLDFLIATHSPSIINENWHLVQDLYDKSKSAEDKENDQP